MEPKARLFLEVKLFAAQGGLRKAVVQRLDALGGGRRFQRGFCNREPQQKRIGPRPVPEQFDNLGGPLLFEKEIGVGSKKEVVGNAQAKGCAAARLRAASAASRRIPASRGSRCDFQFSLARLRAPAGSFLRWSRKRASSWR